MLRQVKLCALAGIVVLVGVGCQGAREEAAHPAVPTLAEVAVAASVAFTEGPAVDAEGNVYFSDITNSRILKWSPFSGGKIASEAQVFRESSGRANGLLIDREGRLVACEGAWPGGNRRVTRTDLKTGKITVLAAHFNGKRLNSPNDLARDSRGTIYFSDPRYGPRDDMELDEEAVYRIEEADGKFTVTRVVGAPDVTRPNGLLVSSDDKTLYVVDHDGNPGGARTVLAFDLSPEGKATNRRVLFDFSPGRGGDGMALDVEGNLYVAAGTNVPLPGATTDYKPGVYVISPEGELKGFVPVPEDMCTNSTFGGPDGKTLYITAGKTLYLARMSVAGRGW